MQHTDKRQLVMAKIMTPDQANFSGNVHGGHLLQFLDEVAYACATRYSGRYVVTLSFDRVVFEQPIKVGELITCSASINYVGRTSMEVGIKVTAQNLRTGVERHTNSCYATMVAVDEQHQPTEVPSLAIRNTVEQRRFDEAKARKTFNIAQAKAHKARKQAEGKAQ